MKKILLTLLTVVMAVSAWATSYKLVETAPSSWEGNYLLVAVNNSTYYSWDGGFGSWGTCVAVGATEISNDHKTITPSATSSIKPITIAAVTGGYSIYGNEKYLGASDKKFSESATAVAFGYISLENDGTVKIQKSNTGSNDYGIRYNHNSGSGGFRVYKAQGTAEAFYLYKEESVTPTVAYTVTFNAGTNGTCSTTSLTEASAGAGVTLPACTPNSGYGFAGWSTTNGGTTPDAGKAGETYNPTATTTLYAVYKTQYTVTWSVNGNSSNTTVLEGEDIVFNDPSQTEINGKKFQGWVASPIASLTDTKPSFVSSAKATGNVTYYAVYATETAGSGNYSWAKITNTNQVTVGVYAIITYDESYYLPNEGINAAPTVKAITKTADAIDVVDDMKWNLTIVNNHYVFESASEKGKYLWGAPTNDGVRIIETSGKASPFKEWILESSNDYGLRLVDAATSPRYLSTYGTQDWRNYGSTTTTNRAANIYKLDNGTMISGYCTTVPAAPTSADITVSAAGYTTYFNSTTNYVMPTGMEGYVWFDGALDKGFDAGDVVKAGEPLVLKATAGKYTLSFTNNAATQTYKADDMNDLEGTDTETTLEDDANSYFYGLSLNASSDPNSVGFYWMAENGAAFTNGAHKAYLKLTKNATSKSAFRFNNTTGIKTLNNEQSVSKAVKRIMNGQLIIEKAGKMYNAAGVEVNP